jgi:hypothetical protein
MNTVQSLVQFNSPAPPDAKTIHRELLQRKPPIQALAELIKAAALHILSLLHTQ